MFYVARKTSDLQNNSSSKLNKILEINNDNNDNSNNKTNNNEKLNLDAIDNLNLLQQESLQFDRFVFFNTYVHLYEQHNKLNKRY
jgi:hypothetical protein